MGAAEILARKVQLEQELQTIRDQLKETNGALIREALMPFFDAHPEIKAIRWNQYTPYFNDGDECVFSSNHSEYPEVLLVGNDSSEAEGDDEDDEDDDWQDFSPPWNYEKLNAEEQAKCTGEVQLRLILSQFTDQDVLDMFGDHVEVVIKRDTIEVEEYSHD